MTMACPVPMAVGTSALLRNYAPHRRQGEGEQCGRAKFDEGPPRRQASALIPLSPRGGRPAVLPSTPGPTCDRFHPIPTALRRLRLQSCYLQSWSGRLLSCPPRALTTAGDGLTTEQFFFFLHNSKLIGGEARNRSNKHGPLLLKRISFSNSF